MLCLRKPWSLTKSSSGIRLASFRAGIFLPSSCPSFVNARHSSPCHHNVRGFRREGEEGDNFYVIETGVFAASKEGETVFRYEGKGAFGELALMYNCARAATVKVGQADGNGRPLRLGPAKGIVVSGGSNCA
jgi:hypothetical protein